MGRLVVIDGLERQREIHPAGRLNEYSIRRRGKL